MSIPTRHANRGLRSWLISKTYGGGGGGGGCLASALGTDAYPRPVSFADVLDRLTALPDLIFTGNPKTARELDVQTAAAGWAEMAWDGLLALQDFARAAAGGGAKGNFRIWCADPPHGSHTFPPRKVIMKESDTVANNTRWRAERTFTVPAVVDPRGRIYMEAHLRIGGGNTVSPRLHFHDDCPRTGRIYIGYIGPHLTNTRT